MTELYAEYLERLQAILAYEFYGISVQHISIAALLIAMSVFVFSGPRDRGVLGRIFDLLLVILLVALLVGCVIGGLYIGYDYGHPAWGALAGVMLFFAIFSVYGTIKTRKENARSRAELAAFLKSKNL